MCQQLGQPRGCLIGWVKVTTYLPTRETPSYLFLRTCAHVHRTSAHAASRARGNAVCRESGTERESVLAKSRESRRFFSEPEIAPRSYIRPVNLANVISGFGTTRSRDTIPHTGLGRINTRCESTDNVLTSRCCLAGLTTVVRLCISRVRTSSGGGCRFCRA